jgi:hypothetical protein
MSNKRICLILYILMLNCLFFNSCQNMDVNSYKTFTLTDGNVHFSLEYRSYYKIKEVHPSFDTGNASDTFLDFTLISPKIKQTKDYTRIKVLADKPDHLIPDAKSNVERAENNASSWANYKLYDKYETTIDGIPAYRLDYQNQNIIPAIAGTGGPAIEVYRELYFDAKGLVWMIQMSSDSSTAEADKADFEHIIQTFKVLD